MSAGSDNTGRPDAEEGLRQAGSASGGISHPPICQRPAPRERHIAVVLVDVSGVARQRVRHGRIIAHAYDNAACNNARIRSWARHRVHIARIAGMVRAWSDGAETTLPQSPYPWFVSFPRDEVQDTPYAPSRFAPRN